MTQYFYVDESGEPGLKSSKRSPYFVLAMVQMPNWEPIGELTQLRETLHLMPSFEFHYFKMTIAQKQAFYKAIRPVIFRVRAAVVLKDEIPVSYRNLNGAALTVELLARLTLRASPLDIGNDVLVIDAATDALRSALRVRLSQECRRINRVRPFNKIATASSQKEDGLQLADMVAGALRDHVLGKDTLYYETFVKRLWIIGKLNKTPRLSQDWLEKVTSLGNLVT